MSFPSFSAVKNAHTSKQTRISTSMENIQSLRRKKPCIFIGCLLLNIPFTAKWKSFFKHYGIAVLVLKISLISKINLSVVLHVCHRIVYLVSLTNGHCQTSGPHHVESFNDERNSRQEHKSNCLIVVASF